MANVLGISALYHDAAAVLVVDGRIECALSEERLSRVKNDPALPFRAARAVLEFGRLTAKDLDRVVFYENPYERVEQVLGSALLRFPRSAKKLPQLFASQWSEKVWVLDRIAEGLGIDRAKVEFTRHHESHAASSYYCSGFESAAIVTVDGAGENATTALWHGRGDELELIEEVCLPHSLGVLYSALTAYLGFEVNEGEYKVMGLAAFGSQRYADVFEQLLRTHPDGSFEIDETVFDPWGLRGVGFTSRLIELLGPPRSYQMPLLFTRDGSPGDDATRRFADIAASLQEALERAMKGLVVRALLRTKERRVCLAGGVALNALCNRTLAELPGVERLFVQPAAGDAGGALGAALLGARARGDHPRAEFRSAALGLPARPARAATLAAEMGLQVRRLDSPYEEAARRLWEGQILAWVEGRSEWGPRALGQRSLLARPDRIESRERLNRVVKHREPYRPFAPAVLEGDFSRYFAGVPDSMTQFMTTVREVLPGAGLPAVTHHDGTARVQSVPADTPFGRLLSCLGERGLPPMVLNTSLNDAGEPIVLSEADALLFFAQSEVDALIVDDVLVQHSARKAQ